MQCGTEGREIGLLRQIELPLVAARIAHHGLTIALSIERQLCSDYRP